MRGCGLIISASRSGAGKTTVTLGILAALRRRGVAVRAAKSGPDYIDAAFHAAATGRAGLNLDSWAMPPPLLDALTAEAAGGAELVVIEGAVGLFDGIAGSGGRCGTTADLAARYQLPVLLVLDVAGQWRDKGSGRVLREPTKLVVILTTDDAPAGDKIADIVAAYKQQFHQHSVGVITRPVCAAF